MRERPASVTKRLGRAQPVLQAPWPREVAPEALSPHTPNYPAPRTWSPRLWFLPMALLDGPLSTSRTTEQPGAPGSTASVPNFPNGLDLS